ncbi:MAG: hypothetical protein AB9835_10185 [Eubacteriales bacterium]
MSYDIYTGLLKMFALPTTVDTDVRFTFDNNHPKLYELKSRYPIEIIAGNGDELSKSINLLNWVSANIYHKGDYAGGIPQNSIDLLNYAYKKSNANGVNCVCLAKILTECLLAIGLHAMQIFIMPCSPYDGDNHVVTHVYIKKLNKWIMLDPTLNAYFTNERGEYLSLLELRNHLANQEPVLFNKEAKYNDDKWTDDSTKENIEYFAKNLFYFVMSEKSTFNTNKNPASRNIILSPQGFDVKYKQLSNIEYRIKKYGTSTQMQNWLDGIRKEECHYCSSINFEASPV